MTSESEPTERDGWPDELRRILAELREREAELAERLARWPVGSSWCN